MSTQAASQIQSAARVLSEATVVHICPPAEATRELDAWRAFADQRGEVWHEWLPHERNPLGTVGTWQARLRELAAQPGPRIWVFHDGWGADLLPPPGEQDWRVAVLHAPYPHMRFVADYLARLVHGFVLPDEASRALVRREVSWLPGRLLHVQPLPLTWPITPADASATAIGTQDVMGFNDWVRRPQQRIERLLDLVSRLRSEGWRGRFEVMGRGPEIDWLERKARRERVDLAVVPPSGRDFDPASIAHWRYAWSLASFEATPLARLEAWAGGVVPIYPRPDNETPTGDALEACRYPQHEVARAVKAWMELEDRSGFAWQALLDAGQKVLVDHAQAQRLWPAILENVLNQPRAKLRHPAPPAWWPQAIYQQRYHHRLWGKVI